jgi:hypothetical protein
VCRTSSPFLQLIGNLLEFLLFVEIRGDEVCFPFAKRIKFFACLFTGFRVTRGYIYVCAVLHEAFADHATDAFGAAGYEDDFALDDISLCIVVYQDN